MFCVIVCVRVDRVYVPVKHTLICVIYIHICITHALTAKQAWDIMVEQFDKNDDDQRAIHYNLE